MLQKKDIELFTAVKDGDKNALSILYLNYYDFLMHYGTRIVPDIVIVEECIQELFLYIYEAKGRLGIVKNIKAYFFSSLRRRILKKIKAERKIRDFGSEISNRTNIQFYSDEILFLKESQRNQRQALLHALNNLSWRQREAIYLRYYNGLSTNEIAEIMGVANQTILNTLYQAMKKLRKSAELKDLMV